MQFHLERSVDVLRRTPATLVGLVSGLDDSWARATEGPETFSPFDVVGHLIDGEETYWIPRARLILDRTSAPFEPYDRFRHKGRNAKRSLESRRVPRTSRQMPSSHQLLCRAYRG